jgi:hypothetical protein
MQEDIGTIINKGFGTWTRNLNICIPFVLNFVLNGLLMAVAFTIFVGLFVVPELSSAGLDPELISPEQMIEIFSSLFSEQIWTIIAGFIVIIPLMMLIQSYFTAGAIGMSKNAAESGNTDLKEMWQSANQNVFNLFLTKVLIALITLTGIVFIVPGVLAVEDFDLLLANPTEAAGSMVLLTIGLLIWMLYIIAVNVMLSISEYALVVDKLDPITALETGFKFFLNNKFDVVLLWMILVALSVFITIIGEFVSSIPAFATIWTFLDLAISIAVIPPLTTIWWTRLLLNRSGRKMYDPTELLMYP